MTDPISASDDEVAHATLSADIATLSVDISRPLLGSLGSRTLTISTLSTLSVESNQPENLEEANLELESPWISQDQPSGDQLLNIWLKNLLDNLPSESTTTGVDLSISEPVTLRQRPLTRFTPTPPDLEQQPQSPVDPQPQNVLLPLPKNAP